MAEKTLNDAFYDTLRDVLYAEKQALKACKKSAKAATNPELKQAFEQHGQETEGQIDRLQQIFELINRPARAKTCEAMQGIMSEMEEDLGDYGASPAADAVIIGCGQAIEHYEIARYGTLISWAKQLKQEDAATRRTVPGALASKIGFGLDPDRKPQPRRSPGREGVFKQILH